MWTNSTWYPTWCLEGMTSEVAIVMRRTIVVHDNWHESMSGDHLALFYALECSIMPGSKV